MASAKQGRTFQGVVYPDSESYDCEQVLALLPDVFVEFAYILHDKDVTEEGELKKAHYHWLGTRSSPVAINTIAKQLGVSDNAVEFCRSYRAFLRYMIHADDTSKHQYSPDDVQGVFKKHFLTGDSEKALVQLALQRIQSGEIQTIQGLAAFAAEQNDWPSFRRNYSLLKDLLHERLSYEGVRNSGWVHIAESASKVSLGNSGPGPWQGD